MKCEIANHCVKGLVIEGQSGGARFLKSNPIADTFNLCISLANTLGVFPCSTPIVNTRHMGVRIFLRHHDGYRAAAASDIKHFPGACQFKMIHKKGLNPCLNIPSSRREIPSRTCKVGKAREKDAREDNQPGNQQRQSRKETSQNPGHVKQSGGHPISVIKLFCGALIHGLFPQSVSHHPGGLLPDRGAQRDAHHPQRRQAQVRVSPPTYCFLPVDKSG